MQNINKRAYIYIPQQYDYEIVHRLVAELTRDGKKIKARNLAISVLNLYENKTGRTLQNDYSTLSSKIFFGYQLLPVRLGAITHRVPQLLDPVKALNRSYKRMFNIARTVKKGRGIADRIVNEIIETMAGSSATCLKLKDLKRTAEHNKTYEYMLKRIPRAK
jgi:ribosomal protein S7